MQQYLDLLTHVMQNGTDKTERTGTGERSVFGYQMRFNLADGFPIVTTKKVFLKGIIHELLWFLRGETNIEYLVKNGVHIWDAWPYKAYKTAVETQNFASLPQEEFIAKIAEDHDFAMKWGELGPVYGSQWRNWPAPNGERIDQIKKLVDQIKHTPDSRRMIVSAWNVAEIDEMAKAGLPPCHTLWQIYVCDGKLSCQLYQRSGDIFLGVPFNIASYALLTMMLAQVCNLQLGDFVHTFGDVHIYHNHFDQVKEQLSRKPFPLPTMKINPNIKNIFDFKFEDFELMNYECHPAIKGVVAV